MYLHSYIPELACIISPQIKRTEVKMVVALANHNISLAVDHLSPLFRDIFPDSKITKGFASARTKTTCILDMALRPHYESALVQQMKDEPFSIATVGSNHNGSAEDESSDRKVV